jgi:hypothetical protein
MPLMRELPQDVPDRHRDHPPAKDFGTTRTVQADDLSY